MNWLAAICLTVPFWSSPILGQAPITVGKLLPVDAVANLTDSANQRYDFIVSGTTDAIKRAQSVDSASLLRPSPLPFISALGLSLTVRQASLLAKRAEVLQVWYVPHSLYPTYCRIIEGLEHAAQTLPAGSVLNISLGPPADVMPMRGFDSEPMNIATKKVADAKLIIVMAIGNYGSGDDDGIVNPWCHPSWVVCVGAASADATRLWSGTARGLVSDKSTWPDVVANGIDVIGPWPTTMVKPADRKKYDESSSLFRQSVPEKDWPIYTLDSGTSESTPQVTRAAAQIVSFLREVIAASPSLKPGDPLFAIEVPRDRFATTSKRGPRLTGDVQESTDANTVQITYRLVEWWQLVKQMLIDSAVPMPDFPPTAVGAGFVDPTYVEKQFPTKQKLDIKIDPIKVLP